MKATGIVRRIDDLGRVVIPKEIRRVLRIREGDPLEIFTEKDGEVIFKKYSPMGELAEFAGQICESLHRTTDAAAVLCDRDAVIAVSGLPRRELLEKHISAALEQIMENRRLYCAEEHAALPVLESGEEPCITAAAPIVSAGDVLGCVLFAAPKGAPIRGETEQKLLQTVAGFPVKQMEE